MARRLNLPVEEIAARYGAGESALALAAVYGVCDMTIARRMRALGVKMHPKGWRRLGGPRFTGGGKYLKSIDRTGNTCCIHRACWEAYHGPIPRRHVVHHINELSHDNRIENLACMTRGEHTVLHKRIALLEHVDSTDTSAAHVESAATNRQEGDK